MRLQGITVRRLLAVPALVIAFGMAAAAPADAAVSTSTSLRTGTQCKDQKVTAAKVGSVTPRVVIRTTSPGVQLAGADASVKLPAGKYKLEVADLTLSQDGKTILGCAVKPYPTTFTVTSRQAYQTRRVTALGEFYTGPYTIQVVLSKLDSSGQPTRQYVTGRRTINVP